MQKDNFLEDLPFEIVQHVSNFLNDKEVSCASKISKSWQTLFNDNAIWKFRFKKEFDIEDEQISQFENKIKAPNYKQLYVHLYYLSRPSQQLKLPYFIKNNYRDKTKHDLSLLACSDNITYLKDIPREQQYIIAILAIYAGCLNIPNSFLEKNKTKKLLKSIFYHASRSGNLHLVKYLLNPENKFHLIPDPDTLYAAASSGNLQLVQYLLKPENKFGLTPDDHTLYGAASSGNLQLVQYLLEFILIPGDNTLSVAAESGNLQLVQYLLKPENKFGLILDNNVRSMATHSGNLQLVQYLENEIGLKPDLNAAAESGNLQLVQYLLNLKSMFWIRPDDSTLEKAAKSGNLQLVQYLLNPENKFGLYPISFTLTCAAESGNLQLVQYLLNVENKFRLYPTSFTLTCAAESGNLQLVQYLLNPENKFDLVVNKDTLREANKSTNFALSEYLLPCHMAIQQALEQLQAHDIIAAKTFLQESYTACPSHHNMMVEYILNNAQRFNLSDSAMECLKEPADVVLEEEKMRPAFPEIYNFFS